jgi:hypothetical protein
MYAGTGRHGRSLPHGSFIAVLVRPHWFRFSIRAGNRDDHRICHSGTWRNGDRERPRSGFP